ncbi:MAG TPA: prolyl oligopeptidase family serine peptidase, partial [Gemmatimonadales bacterium]
GFTYARYPRPAAGAALSPFDVALYHHRLGTAAARDSAVFGPGYSAVAEYRLIGSDGNRRAALLANDGDGSFAEVYLRTPRGWNRVADTTFGVREAAFIGDRLVAIASGRAPHGRLIAFAPNGDTATLVPEGPRVMKGIAPVAGGFLLTTVWGMDWRVDHYSAAGTLLHNLKLPAGIAISGVASSARSPEAVVAFDGWTIPGRWVRYDARRGTVTRIFDVQAAGDYSRISARQFEVVSADGAHVPVTVLTLRGTPQDGSAPAILSSYGGFQLPVTPTFVGPDLAWLERGGILAYANIRGGDEFGETWHQAQMRTRKQHAFDDFYAAARGLVDEHWTTEGHLGIFGRSNGGLLMGTALTQHPEAYRAAVAFVGIYDMMRHPETPNGRYNIPEYGSADDSAQFAAQYAYSALYHVVQGVAYPAVLLETGENDPLVAPWQSREFAAALQGASSSGRPVLLLTRFGAGHGASSFAQQLGNAGITLTFFAHELGLKEER